MNLHELRLNYITRPLDVTELAVNPVNQFRLWMQEAINAALPEPNAMTLATCNTYGRPSARIVLLKEVKEEGFVFFTNYESRKGNEIHFNPWGALCFFWNELHRQVRIEGKLEKISAEESLVYFQSRPRDSQLSAWASAQSNVVPNRDYLNQQLAIVEAKYKDVDKLPLPPFWGGYCLRPVSVEFWQGRENRFHDRLLYSLDASTSDWKIERLSP